MDTEISTAARALAAGDSLAALKRIALRDDPPALALRGIAMAQLGEYGRARALLRRAARRFGADERVARARCVVADAEVALAMRDFGGTVHTLLAAADILAGAGDVDNAMQARLLLVRRRLLLGRLHEAAQTLAQVDVYGLRAALRARAALLEAELALRSLHITAAHAALARAESATQEAGVRALTAEVAELQASLARPAARLHGTDAQHTLVLAEVAALLDSGALVLDACRRGIRGGQHWLPLARRPLLFTLARALAEAWPGDVERAALITIVFNTRHADETHRARLRVEIGRLRALLAPLANIEATAQGFVLRPLEARAVKVLTPPIAGAQAALLALLADGAAWSTSALALALGASQRTVQRALVELEASGQVRALGRARTQRWLAPPLVEFTTILLLPSVSLSA
jgi:hypothetical protein